MCNFILNLLVVVLIAFRANAQAPKVSPLKDKLLPAIKILAAKKDMKNASIGFYAVDLATNQPLVEYNPDVSLTPASIQKLITTATALEVLGKNYKFKTSVEYDGFIDTACVFHGDIYIKGGGDPALGSELFSKNYFQPNFIQTWVDSIEKMGIDSINGRIIGDDEIFSYETIPSTWIWGDLGNYFGAVPNGLSIYENTYKIYFAAGDSIKKLSKINSISPTMPDFGLENRVTYSVENKDLSYIMGAPDSEERYISGTIPLKKENYEVKGSIPNPALVAASELENKLIESGIGISQAATTTKILKKNNDLICDFRKDIASTYSPALSAIVEMTNLISHNLFAEHLALQVALKQKKFADNYTANQCIVDFWKEKGIDTDGMSINDGSGLSRYNTITVRQMVEVLKYMKKSDKNADAFYKSLPVAGKSGTLRSMCKGTIAEGKIHAKSGTVTRVRSYAGYATSKNGKEIAFCIILNNFNCKPEEAKAYLEDIMISMASLEY
jgi:D-alanyl-D-alanine carboxypeptidase/D-alanyl-D-alanine-endopeptidase (penicillin-binding protein 4)